MSKSIKGNAPESIEEEQSSSKPQHQKRLGHDDVSSRAYLLWQERGCPNDSAEEDWLQAEREIESQETELAA